MENSYKEILAGVETAFIDTTTNSNLAYRPHFISNDASRGEKVLTSIENELRRCDSFIISVAFITLGGIEPLLQTLKELEKKQIPGKILTTDYNVFTDPKALDKLAGLDNIELRMYQEESQKLSEILAADKDSGADTEKVGFHTKGYVFQKDETFTIIMGSSNMTMKALTINKEWNTKVVSTAHGEYILDLNREFKELWEDEKHTKEYKDFIDEYRTRYETVKKQRKIARNQPGNVVSIEQYKLEPNSMQVGLINSLRKLKEAGERRAILVSATGTGKTYASAFGVRDVLMKDNSIKEHGDAPKMLFLVHREQIAKQAMRSFQRVFGNQISFGLLSGNSKDYDSKFLFSTMQMMSKPDIMSKFSPGEFKCIVLDEAHKTGAASYQRIIEYFQPDFLLGMTASPERMDDFDVFALFDHNIAYEIRLQQAMEEDLLCPFHYFGITDLEIEGTSIDDETGVENFRFLVCDERVDYIIQQANYYGFSGSRVKGLIFCSRRREAEELSLAFNQRGFKTCFLSGDDSQEKREDMVDRLTSDNRNDQLDYIFTVDIFNEGVDLPEVNQVIMLRPTQSPIVFVQQLGRGLRKANDKEYVVILDFIGNYKNNFMIPIALSGDRTYNKDNVRRYVAEGTRVIPGCSTIHFDEISRKRIFAAIDTANFSDIRLIKENYKNLKYKLGRIPTLMDFDLHGEMDVLRIFDNKSLGSYYAFLKKYEPDYKVRLSYSEEKVIEFISKKLAAGKRIHEIEMLDRMLYCKSKLMAMTRKSLMERYEITMDSLVEQSIVNVMTNEFPAGTGKKSYENCILLEKDGEDYSVSKDFGIMLNNPDFNNMLRELLEFARFRYKRDYSERYEGTDLVLYQKYTYEDACRLLRWEHNEVPLNIGGYKFDRKTRTFPVFINYDKSEDIQDTVKYEDHFISPERLIAISKSNRTVDSEDVQNFLHAKERGIAVELFVRKNKDDKISKEFYYLGHMTASGKTREFIMPNTTSSAVEIEWTLDTPVRADLYEYIVGG